MAESESTESPRKKIKLSSQLDGSGDSTRAVTPSSSIDVQVQKELDVGITDYVSPHAPTFSGILKKRYTDFLVNEILPNGEVLHLRSTRPPKAKTISSGDQNTPPVQNGNNLNTDKTPVEPPLDGSEHVASAGSSNSPVSSVKPNNENLDEVRCLLFFQRPF